MINLENYTVTMEEFCIVLECKKPTPIIMSVPHDSLSGLDFDDMFLSRQTGGKDTHTWPIVKDILLNCDVHVVRGLMPRRFVEYNVGYPDNVNYYPLSQKEEKVALVDEQLVGQYEYYHSAISRLIEKSKPIFGEAQCLLIDMHGFGTQPEYAPPGGYDMIFGTGNRSSIRHGDIDRKLAGYLKNQGYEVFLPKETTMREIEDALGGGYTTRHHSAQGNINAIQIEIAKKFRSSDGRIVGKQLSENISQILRIVHLLAGLGQKGRGGL